MKSQSLPKFALLLVLLVFGGQFSAVPQRGSGSLSAAPLPDTPQYRAEVIFAKTLVPPTERSHEIYYVDAATGDDSNPGTAARPWRTIQKAANTLEPGDTVLVSDGLYVENGAPSGGGVEITHSGAPGAWITYKAFPGAHPRVTSATWATFRID
ncbi:MAG TPA: DUF1565 domain-containing protein [Armatimonadota bacterium]|nr:DUF1565 domain-containing protein [Armatimonadota bacterium]